MASSRRFASRQTTPSSYWISGSSARAAAAGASSATASPSFPVRARTRDRARRAPRWSGASSRVFRNAGSARSSSLFLEVHGAEVVVDLGDGGVLPHQLLVDDLGLVEPPRLRQRGGLPEGAEDRVALGGRLRGRRQAHEHDVGDRRRLARAHLDAGPRRPVALLQHRHVVRPEPQELLELPLLVGLRLVVPFDAPLVVELDPGRRAPAGPSRPRPCRRPNRSGRGPPPRRGGRRRSSPRRKTAFSFAMVLPSESRARRERRASTPRRPRVAGQEQRAASGAEFIWVRLFWNRGDHRTGPGGEWSLT